MEIGTFDFTDVRFIKVSDTAPRDGLPAESVLFLATTETFTPVPEPETFALALLTLAGVPLIRRVFAGRGRTVSAGLLP